MADNLRAVVLTSWSGSRRLWLLPPGAPDPEPEALEQVAAANLEDGVRPVVRVIEQAPVLRHGLGTAGSQVR